MRRHILPILTGLFGFVFIMPLLRPMPVAAISCGPCPATATAYLNLRSEPSLSAEVLRVIPDGASLEWENLTGQVNGFVAVIFDGTEGWAHGAYLLLFPSSGSVTANLNLRDAPSLSADVIMVMPADGQVQVLGGPTNGFFSVRYEQQVSGWASADYLNLDERNASPPPLSGNDFEIGNPVITTNALNYRTEPNLNAPVIKVLPAGTQGGVLGGPVSANG
jgi:uncharacterized protein YraI